MDNFNVVGDVAGNFLTLQALLAKMPKDAELICLGDPNDRGPRSKQVIEFLMKNGKTVFSNHAHMMVDAWKQHAMPGAEPNFYMKGLWPQDNGGMATVFSYGADVHWMGKLDRLIPGQHIKWLEQCPLYIQTDKYLFTHAPLHNNMTIEEGCDLGWGFPSNWNFDPMSDFSVIWNRYVPERPNKNISGRINIFGHNASDEVKVYTTQYNQGIKVRTTQEFQKILNDTTYEVYAIALDTSKKDHKGNQKLTGLHIPSMTLYSQEYID